MNNKFCPNCGRACEDYEKFCPNCGSNLPDAVDPDKTYVMNGNGFSAPPQDTQQQPNQPPVYQYPINNAPKKKKGLKGWHIALIIAGVLVLAGIGVIAEKSFQDQGYSGSGSGKSGNSFTIGETNDNKTKSVSYTKGHTENGYYVNEWANIKFSLKNWPEAASENYSSYEQNKVDCGFLSVEPLEGRQFAVQFEDLSGIILSYTKEDYLDISKKALKDEFDKANVEYNISNNFEMTIGGETYAVIKTDISNGVHMYNCVRILDKHAITISVSSVEENELITALASIEAYK